MRGAQRSALAAISATAALLALALWLAAPGVVPATLGLALFGLIGAVVLARVETSHPFPDFGPANRVTLGRAALACLLATLVVMEAMAIPLLAFLATVIILMLDGVDGWIARRTGTVSRFGARFDMEVDALLVLILSAAAWLDGKAGIWVLLLGLMRYAFVLAGAVWPALAADLPPSGRRKFVCVVQICILAALLLPQVTQPLSAWLALAALIALAWSFAVDVAWLLRRSARA
ncbi:MAG: CDP-alcohol phosphatidyltransferase family protein [Rhizobiaceae bacterium]|nr:CDP-alcohol phosphatidyltransferase family protein [Rhizobiaceae bacterium]MCV0404809.1 CDP-alcohol phosphatidyltransferase family protein [Rhizobiaceae bacterium]